MNATMTQEEVKALEEREAEARKNMSSEDQIAAAAAAGKPVSKFQQKKLAAAGIKTPKAAKTPNAPKVPGEHGHGGNRLGAVMVTVKSVNEQIAHRFPGLDLVVRNDFKHEFDSKISYVGKGTKGWETVECGVKKTSDRTIEQWIEDVEKKTGLTAGPAYVAPVVEKAPKAEKPVKQPKAPKATAETVTPAASTPEQADKALAAEL